MTPNQFRRIALSLPGAVESAHMGHPDFRVGGKIFATLFTKGKAGALEEFGMVKLSHDEQRNVVRRHPAMFAQIIGGWGRQGCTQVRLKSAKAAPVRAALKEAWLLRGGKEKPAADHR